jgi:hypothetical protein
VSFALIIVFIIFGFTFIFYQIQYKNQKRLEESGSVDIEEIDIQTALLNTYLIMFGQWETEDYYDVQMPFFIVITIFLTIILLNLLISIIGDTYQKVQENQISSDNIEKLDVLIESFHIKRIFRRFFWCFYRKKKTRDQSYKYLFWVSEKNGEDEDEEGWEGKLQEINKELRKEIRKIRYENNNQMSDLMRKVSNLEDAKKMIEQTSVRQDVIQNNVKVLVREIRRIKREMGIIEDERSKTLKYMKSKYE